jgi:cobalt-zinc-cadmium efflux system outer membrane protein
MSMPFFRAGVLICFCQLIVSGRGSAQSEILSVPSDSTIMRLVAVIAEASPDLALHRARLAAAEAKVLAAGRRDPLVLTAGAQEVPGGVDLTRSQLEVGVEREWFTGPRRTAARDAAVVERDAAKLRVQMAGLALAATVSRQVRAWQGALAIAARLAAEDSLLTDTELVLRDRFATGDARYVDVLRLRTERLRLQADRAQALAAARTAAMELEGLLGIGDARRDTVAVLLDIGRRSAVAAMQRVSFPAPPGVDSLLAASSADSLGALMVRRAITDRQSSRASRRPQVTAGIGIQRFRDEAAGLTVGPTLSASVSLPFTVPGSNRVLEALGERRVAVANAARADFLGRIRARLTAARERYAVALEQLDVFDTARLTGAREERQAALASYRSGGLSLLELLDFERALSRVETDRLRSVMNAAAALADLLTIPARLDEDTVLESQDGAQ